MNCTTHHHACNCREEKFSKLEVEVETLRKVRSTYIKRLETVEAENQRLREVLKWYGDEMNYRCAGGLSWIDEDEGQKARRALGGKK